MICDQVKFVLFVLLSSHHSALCADRHFRKDYVYCLEIDGWYKVHKHPETWSDARLRCHLEGAVLASPLTKVHELAMQLQLRENGPKDASIFTGIHATFSKGDYFSIEGVPLSRIPHKWAPGEPDNFQNTESCLEMRPDGSLADVTCDKMSLYMCHKSYIKGMLLTSCGTTDKEYEFDARTGLCYKFHRTPKTWSRAYMTCTAEGGNLVVIDSYLKNIILQEIFARNTFTKLLGNTTVASIGYHNWGEYFDWRSIHGVTVENSVYAQLGQAEPKLAPPGTYCGAIYWSSKINDQKCETRNAFICEKSPDSLLQADYEDSIRSL